MIIRNITNNKIMLNKATEIAVRIINALEELLFINFHHFQMTFTQINYKRKIRKYVKDYFFL